MLLGAMERRASGQGDAGDAATEDAVNATRAARRREVARALAARDHAAFSTMIYAGLRIEETTALTVDDLSFARGAEEVRGARGKGNKERLAPMGPRPRRSLRRYLRQKDALVPAGEGAGSPLPHLFVTEKGRRITEGTLRRRLYAWVRESRLKKADIKPPRPQTHVRHLVPAVQPFLKRLSYRLMASSTLCGVATRLQLFLQALLVMLLAQLFR